MVPSRATRTFSEPSVSVAVSMTRSRMPVGHSSSFFESFSLLSRSAIGLTVRTKGKPAAATRRFSVSSLATPVTHPNASVSPSKAMYMRIS